MPDNTIARPLFLPIKKRAGLLGLIQSSVRPLSQGEPVKGKIANLLPSG